MGEFSIRRFVKFYWVVILVPAATALTIFADWNHTKQWKKKLAEENKLTE